MKTKIYKVLSVLLTLAMLFSACVCAVNAEETAQDTIVDGLVYPALASGTVNGGDNITLSNCVGTHATRLYTVNTYERANFEAINVAENCRIYVQFFNEDGTYKDKGGNGWTGPGKHTMTSLGQADAKYFKITFSCTDGGNDVKTPPTDGLSLVPVGYVAPPADPTAEYQGVNFINRGITGADGKNTTDVRTNRIASADFLSLADYESLSIGEGYVLGVAYYTTNAADFTGYTGTKTTVNADGAAVAAYAFADAPEGANYFRIEVKEKNNADVDINALATYGLSLNEKVIVAAEDVYYVSAEGNDENAGTTPETAVTSVAKAVELATAAGATDTVTVKVIGETVALGTLPAYAFDLVVESNDPAVKTKITAVAGANVANNEGKTTTYKNVTVAVAEQWKSVYLASSNIAMEDGANFSGSFLSLHSGTSSDGGGAKSIAGMNMKIGAGLHHFGLSNNGWSGRTYTEDYNLEVTAGSPFLAFNAYSKGNANGSTKYMKNVNIALTGGTGIRFYQLDGATFEGAIQVIDSANLGFDKTYESNATSYADPSIKDALAAVEAEKYLITNATGVKDLLSFTDTAGKYAVTGDAGRNTVKATSADGTKSTTAKDGVLDLTTLGAGEYTISMFKEAETVTYYVASEADGGASANDGKSADKPLLTVAEVIAAANEYGVTATDTVLVKVVGTADKATWGSDVKCNAGIIKVESNDLENLSTIVPPAGSTGTEMGGLVEFDNIKIQGVASSGNPDRIIANGRSVTFGANVTVLRDLSALFPTHQLTSYNNTLTYIFKNAFKGQIYLTHWNNNAITYKKDLNYVVDNANATPSFQVATAYETGGPNKINGNLNIAIYDASSVSFAAKKTTAKSHYVISGALQIITPAKVNADITNLATIGQDNAAPAGGVYHIINATNVPHVVELTNTVGTYKINADLVTRDLILIDKDGNASAIEGDTITVAAGTYKVAYAPAEVTYYVDGSENGDGSESAPFATVAEAIEAANAACYAAGDVVTIKVLKDVTAGTLPKYNFDLIIEGSNVLVPADPEVEGSVDSTRPVKIAYEASGLLANNEGLTTTYENVTIFIDGVSGKYPALGANSASVVFGKNTNFSAGYLTVAYGTYKDDGAPKSIAGQYMEFNGKTPVYINLSNAGWSGRTYTDLVTLVLNAATGNPVLNFNAGQGGSTKFNDDVFINIKDIAGIKEIGAASGATFAKGLYILNSAGIDFTAVKNYATLPADKLFLINNTTGKADLVDFVGGEFDGEFVVNAEAYDAATQKVVVKDADGAEVAVEDGYFYLEEAGIYTITLECIEHAYDSDCDADCNNCGEEREAADHVYDNDCDADCNECGEARTPADHVYDNNCDADCNECGEARTPADHVYDNDCDADCNECGATRTPADHVYDNDCDADCNECGEARTPADHVYDNDCDADCNECGEARTPADHVYDNGCDVDCNECGATRTTTHVYDNDCDADCNECGEIREVADHVYDNNCDADCNECGEARTPADHVYDNDCDADCNECGEARTPADHVYDGETDVDCNECGATRVLGDQLVKEADGIYYYYKDGVKQEGATALFKFSGKWFYIEDGKWARSMNGLVKYSGKWFYVTSGKWDSKVNDLKKWSGKYFLIKNGKWDSTVTTIFTKNSTKFFIKNGKWANTTTTLYKKSGKLVAIKSGKVTNSKVIIKYNGKKYYCYKGYAQTSFSGKVKIGSKTYTVKKGIVK